MYIYCEYPREVRFRRAKFEIEFSPRPSLYSLKYARCTLVPGGINPQRDCSSIVVRNEIFDDEWLANVDAAVCVVYGVFV